MPTSRASSATSARTALAHPETRLSGVTEPTQSACRRPCFEKWSTYLAEGVKE